VGHTGRAHAALRLGGGVRLRPEVGDDRREEGAGLGRVSSWAGGEKVSGRKKKRRREFGPRERKRMRKRVGWAENQGKEGDWFCIFEKEANKFNTNSNLENSNLN